MKVNICGMEYEVMICDDPFGTDSAGQIDFRRFKIRLASDLCLEAKGEALCHEMVHGMLYHLGYSDLAENETLVQGLANAIYNSFYTAMEEMFEEKE